MAEGKNKYSGIKLELGVSIRIQKFGGKTGRTKRRIEIKKI